MTENQNKTVASENAYAIEVENLKKHFTSKSEANIVKAVDDISFKVKEGEFFGLLGPNGAGKTTTIKMLTGLSTPSEGTARIGGYDLKSQMMKIKESISVCPQEPALFKFLSGIENIEFFANLHLMSKTEIKAQAEKFLNLLGLYDVRKRKVKGYSGGMLRQLSLIVSLIHDPETIFLDEPTVGMDPRARRKVWDFLGTIKKQKKTIILTTHYIEEAEALCDRVAIIDYGKLVALGAPQDLIAQYEVKNLEEVFMKITGRSILEGL
ncbi:Glucose import ATP-binding protein GlcV [Candidatus Lokiarchaeum ossiferum]|uniref:Glucose import ATP-binding protein GlcV n=1 Tax=Candidatus Lokiarchaeum ossiferum TaxID=2951803 RepID=A0ABY6HR27_9ARCH|nr:Glucose import ATP-binding protein GlcV [Candidatus Lokiarchaeum sp. B-35]